MTPKTNEQYLEDSGKCPYCDANDLTGDEVNIDGNNATQRVDCLECGAAWTDIYNLSGYLPLYPPAEKNDEAREAYENEARDPNTVISS